MQIGTWRQAASLCSEQALQRFEDLNSGFVQELFAQYLASPEAVDPAWRALFEQAPEELADSSALVQRIRELYPAAGDGNGSATATRAGAETPPAR